MYRREHRHQLSFEDFFLPFGGKLSGDNRWIKLAELIPWDELEDDYAAQGRWFLLLVAVLGILSGCRSSRDLEAFARRHREALNEALGLEFKRWPSDATFLYLFNKAHL
jgi:hypothetical protein